MGRQKHDGRGRIGGRAKGTPNRPKPEPPKPLEPFNEWIAGVINRNRARFENDLDAMEPARRAEVLATLITQQAGAAAPQE